MGNIVEVWGLLFPFLEKAYLEGKISDNFFKHYDTYLYQYEGYQYYGTLGDDIPYKDNKINFKL